jgi:acyl-CoA synthetase (AMP-forming)/AMP-acid ligase II
MQARCESLGDVLRHQAASRPDARAYVFLTDAGGEESVLTFSQLDRQARTIAADLARRAEPGERALLVFSPGLDFIVAFFACLYAGIIAVPMMPPRRHRLRESSLGIVDDSTPMVCLTTRDLIDGLKDTLSGVEAAQRIQWLAVDAFEPAGEDLPADRPSPGRDAIAFLQYTSGSTSAPKGVMVSHGNLLDNLEMIRLAYRTGPSSNFVSWVPLYHDMGLILNVLHSLYVGTLCVLIAPVAFTQRPMCWLKAIDHYRAEFAGAPNFAFDLCVDRLRPEQLKGVDLSCWKIAFNGAEPVRAETLERFAATFAAYGFHARALYPCYGMAEATLLISGGEPGAGSCLWPVDRDALHQHRVVPAPSTVARRHQLVGCGKELIGERIAIVDPEEHMRLGPGKVGEIWVNGANVTQGYWQQPEATERTFRARIVGEEDLCWLRTGDLGCMDAAGELYITGRIKDIIIVRGVNHYPQDIERTVERSHLALRRHCAAAFTILRDGQEHLVVVQEVDRASRHSLDIDAIQTAIRMAVAAEHELTIHDVVLIRTGTIPKTTSGKIRRSLTRELWQNNELEAYGDADVAGHRLVKQMPAAAMRDGAAGEPDPARVAGA